MRKFITLALACVLLNSCQVLPIADEKMVHSHDHGSCSALAYNEIQVGGELQTRLKRNFRRMHDKRYTEAVLFTETADPKWPGDYEGRAGLALILGAQALGIDEPGIDSLMGAFDKHYNEKGYFGTIYLPDYVDEQQLSSHGWTLRALCEYYLWRGKPETKAQIQRIVENLVLPTKGLHASYPLDPGARANKGKASGHTAAIVGKWRLSSDTGCDFIFFDGVVQAYAVTKDERLVPIIEELVDLFGRMDVVAIKAQTHATLTGVRAMIRWYEVSGKSDVLSKAEQTFKIYLSEGCTENFENYNWFGRPEWTEPCAIVDSYLVGLQLWKHTAKPQYLEAAQQIYFNGICATQRSNGGWGLNNCTGSSHPFIASVCPEAYWCCSMRGAEGLAAATACSVFKNNTGIWLTTFMDSGIEAPFSSGILKLKQKSSYPQGESTTLTVQSAPSEPLEIRFFKPSYLSAPQVLVNGKQVNTLMENGFSVINQKWKKGDEITFNFKSDLSRQPLRNNNSITGYELIRRGPLLMCTVSKEQPQNKKNPPSEVEMQGVLSQNDSGKVQSGNTELESVYHLLNPAYDNLKGSWRQMLFAK